MQTSFQRNNKTFILGALIIFINMEIQITEIEK